MRRSDLGPVLGIALLILTGCRHSQIQENSEHKRDTLLKQANTDTVRNDTTKNELKLTSTITCNEDRKADIFPVVGGHVNQVRAQLGDFVNKGEVLAVIRSSDMAGFMKSYISAQSAYNAARKNMDVMEDMYKTGLNSEKEYTQARSDFESAQAELARMKEIRKIYGDSQEGDYLVKSPVSGFVVKKNITEDMELRADNANSLFSISDLSKVWVLANVYETDIEKIKLGNDAEVTTISYPDKVFLGKIDKIFNVLDPDSKVMKVRVILDNPDYILKPEMFATVTIKFKGNQKHTPTPPGAVILNRKA